jgi:hypothetical protein
MTQIVAMLYLSPCGDNAVQCVRKVAVHSQNMLEVMSTNVYAGLNLFNFVRKHLLQICVRKVAVHLKKVLEVMSTSVYKACTRLRTEA